MSFLDFYIGNKHVTKNKSYSRRGKSNEAQSIEARVLKNLFCKFIQLRTRIVKHKQKKHMLHIFDSTKKVPNS